MKKTTIIVMLCLLTLSSHAQESCAWKGYEVKAENSYTYYNVRYASNPMDARHYDTERLRGEYLIDKVFGLAGSFVSYDKRNHHECSFTLLFI